jgi:hypothetical protein
LTSFKILHLPQALSIEGNFNKRDKPDAREIGLNITAGDLTVHDGRLWHRVEVSPNVGEASRRRVMYLPIITGKYMPKSENSRTPFYHRFAKLVLK